MPPTTRKSKPGRESAVATRGASAATRLRKSKLNKSKAIDRAAQQMSRMAAIGQLAGGIAHDFNNLLTVILGHSEFLLHRDELPRNRRMRLEEIRKAAERGAWLTSQLLAFSRNQFLEPTVLHLNTVLEDMGGILRRLLGEDISLDLALRRNLGWVKVDRGQLQQIILNLAGNARDAMPRGGRLQIKTLNVCVAAGGKKPQEFVVAGDYVAVVVSDQGQGMDAETKARIFEPFFTTKAVGKGTGLGLATVYGIVKQSAGYIWVESEPHQGSTFHTLLPRVAKPRNTAPAPDAPVLHAGGESILLVEDDAALRKMAAEVLRGVGYKVIAAAGGTEAIDQAERHRGRLDLLLTDVVMPGMTGKELADELVPRFAGLRVLYMSGYTDDAISNHGHDGETLRVMQKPFTHAVLAQRVHEILRSAPGA